MNIAMQPNNEGTSIMSNEDGTRFSIREIGGAYKVYDKRTIICEAPSMKNARRVRDSLLLDALATKAGLEQETA